MEQTVISTTKLTGKSSIVVYGEGGRELVRITNGNITHPANFTMEDAKLAIKIMLEHLENKTQ